MIEMAVAPHNPARHEWVDTGTATVTANSPAHNRPASRWCCQNQLTALGAVLHGGRESPAVGLFTAIA
jgi:hypothetical protein